MSPFILAAVALGPWSVLAVLTCLAAHRARRARPRVAPPEYVRRITHLPPVPVPLSQLPVCLLTEAELDARFHALVDELERRAS